MENTGIQFTELRTVYVNVYETTRHYGGPEEGGWFWNRSECLATAFISVPADVPASDWESLPAVLVAITAAEERYGKWPHGNIYSVKGGAQIDVRTEEHVADSQQLAPNNWE